jgi:hypothetical protein
LFKHRLPAPAIGTLGHGLNPDLGGHNSTCKMSGTDSFQALMLRGHTDGSPLQPGAHHTHCQQDTAIFMPTAASKRCLAFRSSGKDDD